MNISPDFIKMYLKSTLENAFKTGGRSVVQDVADGLSDEHLGKLIDLLLETKEKRAKTRRIDVKVDK
jgi:hypothetical protein